MLTKQKSVKFSGPQASNKMLFCRDMYLTSMDVFCSVNVPDANNDEKRVKFLHFRNNPHFRVVFCVFDGKVIKTTSKNASMSEA